MSEYFWQYSVCIYIYIVGISQKLKFLALKGYKSTVNKPYLRVKFHQEIATNSVCTATPFYHKLGLVPTSFKRNGSI